MNSRMSVSRSRCIFCTVVVHGFLYAFGSSIVAFNSRWPKINTSKSLGDMERFGCRMRHSSIEPCFIVEAGGFDDERVTVPLSCRITQPARIRVASDFPAIHENLAEEVHLLVEDHDESRRLNNLERK